MQAAQLGLRIKEVGVPRVYLDHTRAFGGALNDAAQRLAYYRSVIAAAEQDDLARTEPFHPQQSCSPCSPVWTCEESCW